MKLMAKMTTREGSTTVEFLTDDSEKYRWRVTSRNGEIIGASSQGFSSFQNCKKNLGLLVLSVQEIAVDGWRTN